MVLKRLCGSFFCDLDTILEEFLDLIWYANLTTSKWSASKKIFEKPSVFAWFCKGGRPLWKSDEINEWYFLSSENGFLLQSFIWSIFDVIWEAFGTSFGAPKPVRTLIRIGGQKMIKWSPPGSVRVAPPYIGGNHFGKSPLREFFQRAI